jgi:AcrR family transcriptional regulator
MVLPRPAARPRLEGDRAREVLDVTLDVLAEVGYDRLTIDLVAARARAGKATLYRRWTSKADLVADALASLEGRTAAPDTGSLLGDLRALIEEKHGFDAAHMKIACGVSTAMATDPDLRRAVQERLVAPRRAMMRDVLAAGLARGEVDEDVDLDLISSVVPAMMIFWTMAEGFDSACAMAPRIVEQVLIPALRPRSR